MRFHVHLHHHFEGALRLMSPEYEAQIARAVSYINSLKADNAKLTSDLAAAVAANGTIAAADDSADVGELSGALDNAGVPPVVAPVGNVTVGNVSGDPAGNVTVGTGNATA